MKYTRWNIQKQFWIIFSNIYFKILLCIPPCSFSFPLIEKYLSKMEEKYDECEEITLQDSMYLLQEAALRLRLVIMGGGRGVRIL